MTSSGYREVEKRLFAKRVLMKVSLAVALTLATASLAEQQPGPPESRSELLWQKLDSRVGEIISQFDGVTGLAILDLTDSRVLLRNADRLLPTASSIKVAILLELYRQDEQAHTGAQGKAKLDDIYTFELTGWAERTLTPCCVTSGCRKSCYGAK